MKRTLISRLCAIMTVAAMCSTVAQAVTYRISIAKDSLQRVTGFGAAAMGTLMCPITDAKIIEKAYGSDSPVGLNILRMELSPNTIGDVTTPWDTQYDWHGYVPAVKMARSKGAIILASPWSPPAIYKTNNSSSGGKNNNDDSQSVQGKLNENGYKNFFPWLNIFVNYMKNQGAPVDIVAIQNEPDWWVDYSGCLYTPQEMHDLVADYAYRFDRRSGVRLMGGEPFYFNEEYARVLLEDEVTRGHIDLIGGHIYCSKPLTYLMNACDIATKYGKETWMTEHTVHPVAEQQGINDVPTWEDQLIFAQELNESMLAGITGYVYWYLYQRWGMIGDGEAVPSGGNKDGEVLPRGYVMSHYAKHLPGAYRLRTSTNVAVGALQSTAYTKGDSIIVNVIDTASTNVTVRFQFPVTVSSGKVITSSSLTSLCKEEQLAIDAPAQMLEFPVNAKTVNTFIFKRDDVTAIKIVGESMSIVKPRQGIYTIGGAKLDCTVDQLKKGMYIINGKKTIIQ